jgi:hypothetical protein
MGAHPSEDFVVVRNEIRQAFPKIVEGLPIRQTKTWVLGGNVSPQYREKFPTV